MASPTNKSVVLTGCGWVTPRAAGTITDVFAACRRSTDRPVLEQGYWAVPDEWAEQYAELSTELRRDRGAWMTGIAFLHARRAAALSPDDVAPDRIGVVLGDALAGQMGMLAFANEVREKSGRFVSPLNFPQTVGNYVAGALSRAFALRGPSLTLAAGVASGLDAVAEGCALLLENQADIVFAGGTGPFSEELARGVDRLAEVPSEGACLFVLERTQFAVNRSARPLAAVIRHWRSDCQEALPMAQSETIVSRVPQAQAGALRAEYWCGDCRGALGAAALTTAIGAADGREVPLAGSQPGDPVTLRALPIEAWKRPDDTVAALVVAEADGGHATGFELSVPLPAKE